MWHEITPSGFPWERAALDYVKERRANCRSRGWWRGGAVSLVLLCVAADERVAPHVDQAAIGMVSSEEWLEGAA